MAKITVNGEEVPVGDGIAHVEMSTTKGTKSYDIVATDKAGNVSSMTLSIEYKKTVPTTSLAMSDSYYGAALATPVVTTDSDHINITIRKRALMMRPTQRQSLLK